jgi:hypothetical protein
MRELFTESLNLDIAVDLDLAGQAKIAIFLVRVPQAEFLQESWRIDVFGRGYDDSIGGTEAIAMTVGQAPQAAIDLYVVLQRRVTHMIALRHLYLLIFTDKVNGWHGFLSSKRFFLCVKAKIDDGSLIREKLLTTKYAIQ